jgi:hypothetical protein
VYVKKAPTPIVVLKVIQVDVMKETLGLLAGFRVIVKIFQRAQIMVYMELLQQVWTEKGNTRCRFRNYKWWTRFRNWQLLWYNSRSS